MELYFIDLETQFWHLIVEKLPLEFYSVQFSVTKATQPIRIAHNDHSALCSSNRVLKVGP